VAQVRRASAEQPWRTVRFTRSLQAVCNLPAKPNPCKAALRASSVPRRITCVTRTSLRCREHCFTWPSIRRAATCHRRTLRPRRCSSRPVPKWAVSAEKERLSPSLLKRGRQPGAKSSRREWMTRCAMCGVRGPSASTGRSLVQGSRANQSQSTCGAQRSRVRSSSNGRCGRWRWQKDRSCKVCACTGCSGQPGGDGGVSKAEHPLCSRGIQPFGQH